MDPVRSSGSGAILIRGNTWAHFISLSSSVPQPASPASFWAYPRNSVNTIREKSLSVIQVISIDLCQEWDWERRGRGRGWFQLCTFWNTVLSGSVYHGPLTFAEDFHPCRHRAKAQSMHLIPSAGGGSRYIFICILRTDMLLWERNSHSPRSQWSQRAEPDVDVQQCLSIGLASLHWEPSYTDSWVLLPGNPFQWMTWPSH